MRILFVDNLLINNNNPFEPFDLQPHLGLLSLIGLIENAGHQGALYDPKLRVAKGELSLDESLYRQMAYDLLQYEPDVIGLTSLGCNFICTVKVASHVKSINPDLPILLGGPHATILDRQIISRFPQIDVIVRNEAEMTLIPLLDSLRQKRLEYVQGITFRRGSEVVVNPGSPLIEDLDALPWPAYEHYPIKELNLTSLRVEAGRGCPFKCTFCSTASFFGRMYRLKSAKRLCSELDYLHSQFGISDFGLMHDLFTVNRAKVRAFCEEVEGRGYTWSCSARMDCVDASLLERMQAAGCRSIYYGIETGSMRMQRIVEKNQSLALFDSILDATQRTGIAATASFITGYPQEQQADQSETLDLIGSCFNRPQETLKVQLHLLTPEPGTKMLKDFADQIAYDGHITDFNFPTLESDDAEIMERDPEIFINHHYYRSLLLREQHIFVTLLFGVLYSLGFTFLAHLLTYYDGRLSRLMAAISEWAERNGSGSVNESLVSEFIGDTWGRSHYLTSLTRYLIATNHLPKKQPQATRAHLSSKEARIDPHHHYVLNSRAALLRNIHNCPEILRILATDRLRGINASEDSLLTRRGHFLIFLVDGPAATVRNFALDEATADLLEFLSTCRSYADCRTFIRAKRHDSFSLKATLSELLRLGVIDAVETRGTRTREVVSTHQAPELNDRSTMQGNGPV